MGTGKLMDMVEVFEELEDWRNAQQTRHRLSEMLTIAVCAVLSGADDFEDISQWERMKLSWLRGFLSLDYGIASPDTFERVFAVLDEAARLDLAGPGGCRQGLAGRLELGGPQSEAWSGGMATLLDFRGRQSALQGQSVARPEELCPGRVYSNHR